MLDKIFDKTVEVLEFVSERTGLSYKKVNAIGFLGWLGLTAYLVYKTFSKN
jgi:hypothetical protein